MPSPEGTHIVVHHYTSQWSYFSPWWTSFVDIGTAKILPLGSADSGKAADHSCPGPTPNCWAWVMDRCKIQHSLMKMATVAAIWKPTFFKVALPPSFLGRFGLSATKAYLGSSLWQALEASEESSIMNRDEIIATLWTQSISVHNTVDGLAWFCFVVKIQPKKSIGL